jgi:hypothetical protein
VSFSRPNLSRWILKVLADEHLKFGDKSIWGWVLGAEFIVGGTVGAGVAVIGASAATGGVAMGAAPWIAAGGFTGGAAALIAASKTAQDILKSDTPPPIPSVPERPALKAGDSLSPSKDRIYTGISGDGRMWGSSPDGIHILTGKYSNDDGYADGTITLPNR